MKIKKLSFPHSFKIILLKYKLNIAIICTLEVTPNIFTLKVYPLLKEPFPTIRGKSSRIISFTFNFHNCVMLINILFKKKTTHIIHYRIVEPITSYRTQNSLVT